MSPRDDVLTVVDVGSAHITAVIAQRDPDGSAYVKGVRRVESEGISKGRVRDLNRASRQIDEALSGAAYSAGLHFDGVWVSLKTPDLRTVNAARTIEVPGESGEITPELVTRAVQRTEPAEIPDGYQVARKIIQEFEVDGEALDGDPSGMFGSRLGVHAHVVLAPTPHLNNLSKVFERLEHRVEGFLFSPQSAGLALLTEEQREAGSLLLDIGGDLTGYAIFNRGAIRHSGVIPVASSHYDRDIKHGLSVSREEAERLKMNYGRVWMDRDSPEYDKQIDVRHYGKRMYERMERSELVQIMNPRSQELFDLLVDRVTASREFEELLGEVVLCGGGARLKGMAGYAGERFAMDATVGSVTGFPYLSEEHRGPEMATALGMVADANSRREFAPVASDGAAAGQLSELLERLNEWGLRTWETVSDFLSGKELR